MNLLTLVRVFGSLAGVATAVGATFLLSGAFSVMIAALHAGCREAARPFRRQAGALLHCQHRLKKLAAGHTLPVPPGESPLEGMEKSRVGDMIEFTLRQKVTPKTPLISRNFSLEVKRLFQKNNNEWTEGMF